jgi:hypothetical protein
MHLALLFICSRATLAADRFSVFRQRCCERPWVPATADASNATANATRRPATAARAFRGLVEGRGKVVNVIERACQVIT